MFGGAASVIGMRGSTSARGLPGPAFRTGHAAAKVLSAAASRARHARRQRTGSAATVVSPGPGAPRPSEEAESAGTFPHSGTRAASSARPSAGEADPPSLAPCTTCENRERASAHPRPVPLGLSMSKERCTLARPASRRWPLGRRRHLGVSSARGRSASCHGTAPGHAVCTRTNQGSQSDADAIQTSRLGAEQRA